MIRRGRFKLYTERRLSALPLPRLHFYFEARVVELAASIGTRGSDPLVMVALEVSDLPWRFVRALDWTLPDRRGEVMPRLRKGWFEQRPLERTYGTTYEEYVRLREGT